MTGMLPLSPSIGKVAFNGNQLTTYRDLLIKLMNELKLVDIITTLAKQVSLMNLVYLKRNQEMISFWLLTPQSKTADIKTATVTAPNQKAIRLL